MKYEILLNDENVIAVNKPEGIASITENDVILNSFHALIEKKFLQKFFIVHRLDKEVSGVILFAKNELTHKFLNNQFTNRSVRKFYIALVHGIIKENNGVISRAIREFGSGRMGVDNSKGKKSETKYHVLERFDDYTLLQLNPLTGRRHQLRVHLYSIGHPIVGDLRYGDKKNQERFPRLMLHAKRIEFQLPDGKKLSIEAPLPDSFKQLLSSKRVSGQKSKPLFH